MSVTGWRNALGESNILIKQHVFFNYAYWSSASLIWKQSLVQTTLFYLLGLPGLRHTAMGMNLYISLQLSRGSKLIPALSFYLPPKYYMMPLGERMRLSRGGRPGGHDTRAAIWLGGQPQSDWGTASTPATHLPSGGSGGHHMTRSEL